MTELDQWAEEALAAGWNPAHVMAVRQVADWARAYVENETALPETPVERLTPAEFAGLDLLFMAFSGEVSFASPSQRVAGV